MAQELTFYQTTTVFIGSFNCNYLFFMEFYNNKYVRYYMIYKNKSINI